VLVELERRRIVPDLILFADTGGEKPATYFYLPVIQEWLAAHGMPPVTVVRVGTVKGKRGDYSTLEQNCLVNGTLPSLAFGRKACSLKWKRAPQDRYVAAWAPARAAWARGERVRKVIGYDAGPKDAR